MEIEYRLVPDYPEYRVGSDGSIWSSYAGKRGHANCKPGAEWKRLKQADRKGYTVVHLRSSQGMPNGTKLVHRLVASAFLGPPPVEGMDVCHADGNRANNVLTNLRYDTRKGNMTDQLKHGTRNRGERQGLSKLTAEQVLAIRAKYKLGQVSQYALAVEYGVTVGNINQIILRRSWAWLDDVQI